MTRAAALLNTVQSNVTARIKRLEDQLGATLVLRSSRKLRLTPEGEALMPFALRLEELCRDIHSHFGQSDGPQAGSLRIGSIETFVASQLVGVIAGFAASHPSVDISVQTGGTNSLWQKVLKSELDVAFVSRRANESAFFEERVFEDELVMIARQGIASLADLAKPENARSRILVQRTGCSFTARLIDYLRETGAPQRPMHAVGTLEGVIGSVRAGGGIAVLPRSYLNSVPGVHELSKITLPEKFRSAEIFLVVQRWKRPIRLLDAFVQSCLSNQSLGDNRSVTG
jgi:DNA-binding transcriptional LysR family regulator